MTVSNDLWREDRKKKKKTVGKGENADNKHFQLFPHCFLPFP